MVDKDEALKLGLQVIEAAEYLANNPAIFGEYVQEKRALKRALIQRSKIAFEEALAQSESESDDLTAAYMSGVYDGKNKDAPRREWVGLAAEDRLTAKYMQGAPDGIEAVIDYIEAKLREKNGG